MLFNSFDFWVVFPFVFLLYWLIPSSALILRKWFLIVVSYLLYMNWKPAFALVLFYVTSITYIGGLVFRGRAIKKRVYLITLFVILAIGPLMIYKYYNFLTEICNGILSYVHLQYEIRGLNWAIPMGISFFTFQSLGYMLDVCYGKIKAEKSFSNYLLFCSFFPQIVSGPISKASELLPQIKKAHTFCYKQGVSGLKILLWGMFLKCVMADRLGMYVDIVFSNYEHFSSCNCIIASCFYSFQIYGDFAGYSLMALGVGKMLGYNLVNNFKYPYLSDSITAFWRHWHISLTRWLTSYIYIPLGGNRCSKTKQNFNIMLTFLVSGLWHGANWTFIFWGFLHGFYQIVEKVMGIDPKGKYANSRILIRIKLLRIFVVFILVTFAWIFFRMPNLSEAMGFLSNILFGKEAQPILYKLSNTAKLLSLITISIVVFEEYLSLYRPKIAKYLRNNYLVYIVLFVMLLSVGVLDSGQFIYANF